MRYHCLGPCKKWNSGSNKSPPWNTLTFNVGHRHWGWQICVTCCGSNESPAVTETSPRTPGQDRGPFFCQTVLTLSLSLSVCLPVRTYVCFYASKLLCIYVSVFPRLLACMHAYMYVSMYLSISPSPSIFLSFYPPVYLAIHLSMYVWTHASIHPYMLVRR